MVRVAADGIAQAAAALAAYDDGVVAVHDSANRAIDHRALPAAAGRRLLVGPMPRTGGVRVRLTGGGERFYSPSGAAAAADDPSRHAAMLDLARRYGVAGLAMSFLALERPDQYLRAGLAPPPGFPATRMEEYRDAEAAVDRSRADAKRERLGFVLERWRERRAWWARRFTPRPRAGRGNGATPNTAPMPGEPPPAPPSAAEPGPPPASAPALAARAETPRGAVASDGSDLIVTATRTGSGPTILRDRPRESRAIALDLPDLLAKRPYLAVLDATAPAARLAALAEQESAYGGVPTFYPDVAEWFRLKGAQSVADLLLLSALELPASDDETRQIVAFRLERDGSYDRAAELSEELAAANAEFRP